MRRPDLSAETLTEVSEDRLDSVPCGYLVLSDDGHIVTANDTLHEMLGVQAHLLEGRHVDAVFPPPSRIFYQTHVFPLLRVHGEVEEIYLALRTTDGQDIPVLVNAVRRERDGKPVNVCVLMRVRQRLQYESAILEAKRAAEAARRSAEQAQQARTNFLSMMSHDLRTPIQAITLFLDVLERERYGPLNESQHGHLGQIRTASRELSTIFEDILAFARGESGQIVVHLQPIAAAAAIARAEALLRVQIEEAGQTLSVDLPPPDVFVLADPDRLQQVLLNLLVNAMKFTPEGGQIRFASRTDAASVHITVSDTGRGIPEDRLETIFEPWTQVDPHLNTHTQRGTGLGLAIGRQLVEAMGGSLQVESTVGAGSTFTVALPRTDPPAHVAAEA